uniref:Uncharacterized protein n=1 Tax=Panagrolaimus superbus TaxID=310955 RepID=A0A914YSI6_9BILA
MQKDSIFAVQDVVEADKDFVDHKIVAMSDDLLMTKMNSQTLKEYVVTYLKILQQEIVNCCIRVEDLAESLNVVADVDVVVVGDKLDYLVKLAAITSEVDFHIAVVDVAVVVVDVVVAVVDIGVVDGVAVAVDVVVAVDVDVADGVAVVVAAAVAVVVVDVAAAVVVVGVAVEVVVAAAAVVVVVAAAVVVGAGVVVVVVDAVDVVVVVVVQLLERENAENFVVVEMQHHFDYGYDDIVVRHVEQDDLR